jgi:hypothetical protein
MSYMFTWQIRCIFQLRHLTADSRSRVDARLHTIDFRRTGAGVTSYRRSDESGHASQAPFRTANLRLLHASTTKLASVTSPSVM